MRKISDIRTRWAAVGAAIAITLGAGGFAVTQAAVSSGSRPVFVPITACRIADTRPQPEFNVGPRSTPIGDSQTHTITAHGTNGNCTIPADATALSLNVTALGATLPTFLTIWAANIPRPEASSLNPTPGQPPTPNAVTTELNAGQFNIFNRQGSVDVVVDVNGYYVDHDHDDRYYTKTEVDTDRALTKWISISPAGVKIDPTDGFYQSSAGGDSGLILIDETNASYGFGFTMPPDYTSNTSISIDLTFRAVGTTPCVIGLRPNTLTISRVGIGLAVLTTAMPSSFNTASPGATKPYKVTVPVATTELGMVAGDAVNVSFFRPTDTCTGVVFLQGIMVRYS
jgi:hypothetical protein